MSEEKYKKFEDDVQSVRDSLQSVFDESMADRLLTLFTVQQSEDEEVQMAIFSAGASDEDVVGFAFQFLGAAVQKYMISDDNDKNFAAMTQALYDAVRKRLEVNLEVKKRLMKIESEREQKVDE